MSSITYIASDALLKERRNPHERLVSVNEALKMGITNIHEYLLSPDFDRDKPNVLLICDREININVDTGEITDGDFDDDFDIWTLSVYEKYLRTAKKHRMEVSMVRFTEGRGQGIINYIRDSLNETEETELWHIWLDDNEEKKIEKRYISIDNVTPSDIKELMDTDVFTENTQYCLVITK